MTPTTPLRDAARARLIGKLVRKSTETGPTGIVLDVDFEHVFHPDRPVRAHLDSGLVVEIQTSYGTTNTYWYHLPVSGAHWETYEESRSSGQDRRNSWNS